MSSTHERVQELRRSLGLKQEEFAQQLGVTQSYISSMESGSRNVSGKMMRQLSDRFAVSQDWLLTGRGAMWLNPGGQDTALAPVQAQRAATPGAAKQARAPSAAAEQVLHYASGKRERILAQTVDNQGEPNIVMVPVKAQAGYAAGRLNQEYLEDLPAFNLPDARFRYGSFRAFEVSGDSMEPTLFGGDVVICRYVEDWRWLRDNELYVAVLNEDVLVKRIRNRVVQQQALELVSDNTFYPPLGMPVTEVLEIWQVFARLTLHLPAPPRGA